MIYNKKNVSRIANGAITPYVSTLEKNIFDGLSSYLLSFFPSIFSPKNPVITIIVTIKRKVKTSPWHISVKSLPQMGTLETIKPKGI